MNSIQSLFWPLGGVLSPNHDSTHLTLISSFLNSQFLANTYQVAWSVGAVSLVGVLPPISSWWIPIRSAGSGVLPSNLDSTNLTLMSSSLTLIIKMIRSAGSGGTGGLGGVLPPNLDFNNLGDSELQNLLNNMSQVKCRRQNRNSVDNLIIIL